MSLEWIDERFQWNPGQYAATESIRVQGKDIWFPSIKDLLIFTCDHVMTIGHVTSLK